MSDINTKEHIYYSFQFLLKIHINEEGRKTMSDINTKENIYYSFKFLLKIHIKL